MVIVWGSRLYGRCDVVPGLCHVATKFGHLWYIPLIPMGSWIILSEEGDGWRGKEMGFSFKSFLIAWLRAALVVGVIAGIIGTITTLGDARRMDPNASPLPWIVLGVGCLGAMVGSYFVPGFSKASHSRARELAEELGLDESGLLMIDVAYGVIDEQSADYEMKKIRKRQEVEEPYDI